MYINSLVLDDGTLIYPQYMDHEKRIALKKELQVTNQKLRCSCRNDIILYYKLSEDLRFYPIHNNYEHSPLCMKYLDNSEKRKIAFVRTDSNEATLHLQFNPKNFSIPSMDSEDDDEQELSDETETTGTNIEKELTPDEINEDVLSLGKYKAPDVEKEPRFNLINFIKAINNDTFSDRMINNKPLLSSDYFTNAVIGRTKFLKIQGTKKMIADLTLEVDKVKFIYAKFLECEISKKSTYETYNVTVAGFNGNPIKLFTFKSIYEKAKTKYIKTYGIEPHEGTMVSGFQYLQTGKSGKPYRVLGRIHLFEVNNYGIYANTLQEVDNLNVLCDYYRKHKDILHILLPVEDSEINAIIDKHGCDKKGILIFPSTNKVKKITFDSNLFVPLLIKPDDELTEQKLDELISLL